MKLTMQIYLDCQFNAILMNVIIFWAIPIHPLNTVITRGISAYDVLSPIKGYPVKTVFFDSSRVRKKIQTINYKQGMPDLF